MTVDRLGLDAALSPFCGDSFSNRSCHVWGQHNEEHFKLDSLVIHGLGAVKVPLKNKTCAHIIKKFIEANAEDQSDCCQVLADNICIPNQNELKKSLHCATKKAFRERFGISVDDLSVDFEVCFESLLICDSDETYEKVIGQKTHQGTFGTLLLQLPFDSIPCTGVKVKIIHPLSYGTRKYKYQKNTPFHLTFVAGDGNKIYQSKLTIEPLNETPVAFLIFKLVWLNSLSLDRVFTPGAFLQFLSKVQQASQALCGWRNILKENDDANDSKNTKESLDTKKIPLLRAEKTKALCVPLRHSYCSFDYQMSNLKKHDVLMENILKAIPDLDVNLVILEVENPNEPICSMVVGELLDYENEDSDEDSFTSTKKTKETSTKRDSDYSDIEWCPDITQMERVNKKKRFPIISWQEEAASGRRKSFSVHQWVRGDWMFPNLHKEFSALRYDQHLVGDIASVIEDKPIGEASGRETPRKKARTNVAPRNYVSYHPAIIVRPRKEAIAVCWEHCPIRTLQFLTRRLISSLDQIDHGKESERRVLIQDVALIFDLTIKRGNKLSDCHRTAILHQLLFICTSLEAIDEGLKIMESIPKRQCNCTKSHKMEFETFISDSDVRYIEDVVVDFVSIAGWERCSSAVFTMFSRQKGKDYVTLSRLGSSFAFNGWADAAIAFTKSALEILARYKDGLDRFSLERDGILEYVHLAERVDQQSRLEIYELLGRVAANDFYTLCVMVDYFFRYLDDDEENLEDLKVCITRIVAEVDLCTGNDYDIYLPMCFLYKTRNGELLEKLWTNFLQRTTHEEKKLGLFERLLSNYDDGIYVHNSRLLYDLIASSQMARERFYNFIEDVKSNMSKRKGSLYCTFCHLTTAELEPGLADTEKLQSFCSAFKEMSVEWLGNVAAGIASHNKRCQSMPHISQTICTALLDCLPTNDLSHLIALENKDFCHVIGSYVNLGCDASKLHLINILKETFLNGNEEDLDEAEKETSDRLLNAWLACLKTKLCHQQSSRSVIVCQIFNFLKFFLFQTIGYSLEEAKEEDFNSLSQLFDFEFLEVFLIAIFERESEGSTSCLKGEAWRWNVCKIFSDMLATHSKMKQEILKFDIERILKVMCCFLWIGCQVSNERFAHLVCSIPFSSRRFISMMLNSEVKRCYLGSPFAFTAVEKVFRLCFERLFFEEEAHSSREKPDVMQVEEFYRLNQKSKSFGPFEGVCEAKRFGKTATNDYQWASYAISVTGSYFYCEITKFYPEFPDDDWNCSAPFLCESLRLPFDRHLSERSLAQEISKHKDCALCLSASVKSMFSTC